MKIHIFNRKAEPGRNSIEKVFDVIKKELVRSKKVVSTYENPYGLGSLLKSLFYFRARQGDINHITGDIHWACLFLDRNRTVLTIHDLVGIKNYDSYLKKRLYLLFWLYLPLWKLKYITVISAKTRDEILQYCPSAAGKIRVIPNPLTLDLFYRKLSGGSSTTPQILVVGTRENKNIDRIIEATMDLRCIITILGALTSSQLSRMSESHTEFISKSFITEIELQNLYRSSDILLFPSLYEGFGMPIIEAQASGCAVITSSLKPMSEVAADAALFVDPMDVADIRNKINQLLSDSTLKNELVEKGYINAKKYVPAEICKQYLSLYEEMAKHNEFTLNH